MTGELQDTLSRIEDAVKVSKPFIQIRDALTLYYAVLDLVAENTRLKSGL